MKKSMFFLKTTILSIVFFATTILCHAQTIDRDVVASSGDYFEGPNSSISWILGEIATETLTDGNFILTQGFHQPYGIVIHGIDMDTQVNNTDKNEVLIENQDLSSQVPD